MRRPRITWLLDTPDPTGTAMMTARRARVLRRDTASVVLTLSGATSPVPRASAMHGLPRLSSLTGELRIARSDIVVTTSERTLATAAPRISPGTRLVHIVHERPSIPLASDKVMRTFPRVAHVVVPLDVDPSWFAGRIGLSSTRVSAADDFTTPDESLLGSARSRVLLAVGRLGGDGEILDVVEAFGLATPDLPGWQLRIVGGGPGLVPLTDEITRRHLTRHVCVLGPRHDVAEQYLAAGAVVRLGRRDVSGLSVHEALAAGVPVLGADTVPAVRRLVRHDANGWVLDRVDPAAIADGIVAVAERRERLGATARDDRAGLLGPTGEHALRQMIMTVLDDDQPTATLPSDEEDA